MLNLLTVTAVKTMSSSNNSTISESKYLPPEVWTHILSSLPAKTLIKFRCVCKSWLSIINHPDFVQMHFQHSQINSENNTSNKLLLALEGMGCSGDVGCVLSVRDAQTLARIDRIFRIHSGKFRILGNCNGLLLVGLYALQGYLKELRFWNPCIRKSLIFPICPLPSNLASDRDWYVFGFANDTQDYKVVKFAFDKTQNEVCENIYIAVYTLRDQQWIVRNNPLNVGFITDIYNGWRGIFHSVTTSVFFRGVVHWLGKIDVHREACTHLVSFDFDQETLTFLELPFTCEEEGSLRFLFFLEGSLAVFSISKVSSSIWVLEQDNQKGPWTLLFSGKSSEDGYEVFKLCSGNLEKVFYFENDGGYLVCGNKTYNIASGQVEPFKRYMSSHLKLEKYWESLVLFRGYGARDLRSFP